MKRGRATDQGKKEEGVRGPGCGCDREGDAKPTTTHDSTNSLLRVHEWGLNPVFWVSFCSSCAHGTGRHIGC